MLHVWCGVEGKTYNSSIHSSSDKENINTNLDTPDPVSCASPLYSSIVSLQSTVANSASVSSPAKRLPLASVTNLLPGDTPKSSARFKSPLCKHLDVVPGPLKEVKTGKARVLTSAECVEC